MWDFQFPLSIIERGLGGELLIDRKNKDIIFFTPPSFKGDDSTSLCKILYPQSNNPQLTGVVKRLPMRLDRTSRIRFRYFIKTTVKPSWLCIDLPLASGERVRARTAEVSGQVVPCWACSTWAVPFDEGVF